MGRHQKYKKVKAFDRKHRTENSDLPAAMFELPHKKRKRATKKQREFNLPPVDDDVNVSTTKKSADIVENKLLGFQVQSLKDEARMARMLKLDTKTSKFLHKEKNPLNNNNNNNNKPKIQGRMEGESMRAFHRRVKQETAMILKKEQQPTGMPSRKKEYLKNKKLKKKKKSQGLNHDDVIGDGDSVEDKDVVTDRVIFGEQAERPPEFTTKHLPRGAKKKINSEMTGEQLRLQAIEKMKARAEAHYAQLKAKRKKAGDFHL